MAINKGDTDKAQWELSKEGKMPSHLGEIKKSFKGVDIWAKTLKTMGFVNLEFEIDSKGHSKWMTQTEQRHRGGNRIPE